MPYVVDPMLVRGLDYYTRTTFEFVGPKENENSTICGGGRYDGLVEAIGGPPTPGIGFGAGLERLHARDRARGARAAGARAGSTSSSPSTAGRASGCSPCWPSCARAAIAADTDYAGRSLKGQLTQSAAAARRRS